MNKKLFISIGILLACIFSFNFCSAADGLQNIAEDVRNAVGGAENAVEDAAKDVSNASKDATGSMENTANNAGDSMKNTATNIGDSMKNVANNVGNAMSGTTSDNGDYTATRTSTTGNNATFMGMTATAWTWLILGVAAIAIVALVWYYSMQVRSSNYDDRD